MAKFSATFSNGETITRNSDHAYRFAWAILNTETGKVETKGFSADRANAQKAAQARMPQDISAKDKKRYAGVHKRLAADKGMTRDAWYEMITADTRARLAVLKIEIVPL